MEKEKSELIEEISDLMQCIAHTWKFVPEAWMGLDLTTMQLKSLFYIDFEGSTNFKNLATALGVTPPSVTGIVDRLVDQDLISREENPENRRMQVLKVTDKGKALLEKLMESRRTRVSSMLEGLSLQDLSTLARIMGEMAGAQLSQDKAGNGDPSD